MQPGTSDFLRHAIVCENSVTLSSLFAHLNCSGMLFFQHYLPSKFSLICRLGYYGNSLICTFIFRTRMKNSEIENHLYYTALYGENDPASIFSSPHPCPSVSKLANRDCTILLSPQLICALGLKLKVFLVCLENILPCNSCQAFFFLQ